jgi:hypothetical protein
VDPKKRIAWLAARTKHGAYTGGVEKPEHYVWRTMHARCNNPKAESYKYYGAKGIKVCKRWDKYENFFTDMGPRPSKNHSLERKHGDGDYKPSNCRWATHSEQQKNKTTTRLYTDGKFTGTLVECAAKIGISKELAYWRMKTWKTFIKGSTWQELQKAR